MSAHHSPRRFIGKRIWNAPEPDEPEELTDEEIEQNARDLEDHAADQAFYAECERQP